MTTNNIINDKDIYYDLSPLDIELVDWVCSRRDVLCFTIDFTQEI